MSSHTETFGNTTVHIRDRVSDRERALQIALLVGRIFFSLIFLISVPGHFTRAAINMAAQHGVPLANIAVPLSGLIALVGALSIIFGYKVRIGAWFIVAFLVPVTLFMHDFWNVRDAAMHQLQQIQFMKNLSMLGGALILAYFGSGPLSVDGRLAAHRR